jgi:sugar lactone lactonase YvrE/thiol-disulfide isomerase/thioredoxin
MSTQFRNALLHGRAWHVALAAAVVTVALVVWFGRGPGAVADAAPLNEAAQQPIAAPELEGGTAWLNSAGPIRLADLKGRVVLIDFWTLCCINCIHTLPDLAKLEAKYPGVLVVIGIHTPKFDNEKNTESIRKAVLRYEISHPVINDANMVLWKRYGVSSWPTLVLIDPEGNIHDAGSGEGHYEVLDKEIGELVKKYRAKKMLVETPLKFELARNSENGESLLFFPGKVVADEPGNRLFIADSTHHRIVITDLAGKKIAIAGSGTQGFKDGAFADACFSDPQGMALIAKDDTLYVADRKNHAIRALDLKNQTVKTVAGTGKQDRTAKNLGGAGTKTGLNSPWDLLYHNGKIFIAMAGHHQVWTYSPSKFRVDPFAGTGREDIIDGPPAAAAFAQPSGLATDGKTLWVADSETSSIRAMPIAGGGTVTSVVGQGLFEFGDINGVGKNVRLQHALGVSYKNGMLYVADTYNSKIKLIDPSKRSCSTFVGERGGWLSAATFNEPGGLTFAGDKMYVADTNGHRIRVVDMKTQDVSTLQLSGVEAPKLPIISN